MNRRRFFLAASGLAIEIAGTSYLVGSGSMSTERLLPVKYWQERFDALEPATRRKYILASRSANSWALYHLAYGIDAYTSMARASGDHRYLVMGLELVENAISTSRMSAKLAGSQYHDEFLGWASGRADTVGREVPLFESYAWRYVTALVREATSWPDTAIGTGLRGRLDRVLDFSRRQVFEKWYQRGTRNIFRGRTHMASHWAYIAMNLAALVPDGAERDRYLAVMSAIDHDLPTYRSSLKGQLWQSPDGAYVWSDVWGGCTPQDVSHGNNVVSYVTASRELGLEWSTTDMARFSRTLNNVWLGPGSFSSYVDGSGHGDGFFSDGFVKLGRFDLSLQQRLQRHTVQDLQYCGAMAVNARVLLACPGKARTGRGTVRPLSRSRPESRGVARQPRTGRAWSCG